MFNDAPDVDFVVARAGRLAALAELPGAVAEDIPAGCSAGASPFAASIVPGIAIGQRLAVDRPSGNLRPVVDGIGGLHALRLPVVLLLERHILLLVPGDGLLDPRQIPGRLVIGL